MIDFQVPSLLIDPETMQEANDATSWLLKVPDTARVGGKASFWTELFDVIGSEFGVVEDQPERLFVRLNLKVAAESPDATNVGRPFNARYLINPDSLKGKDSKERKMSLMAIGRLKNFLTSAGLLEATSSGLKVDFKEFFFGEGSPVVGAKVYAVIKHYKDKDGVQRQDISQFDSLDAGAPAE